ncbi:MAG: TRAP transporter TatT component family protein [Spirochaetaceae bacterium]|jgi:predicted anti-sigma-YlaC factor YlaD|nr:TRAP transporter TatT component family protein [Spirochaetaceae bacterium]
MGNTKRNSTLAAMLRTGAFIGLVFLTCASCSINRLAMKKAADMMGGGGSTEAFTGDNDIELVGDALPFAIKMYETLLVSNPDHQGLLLTTGSLFIMYSNAYVQSPAEMLDNEDYLEKEAQLKRARQLYLRGAALLYRALDNKYPGFSSAGETAVEPYLAKMKKDDVPLLYWTTAGILSAYALDIFDFELGAKIGTLEKMMKRAYELDPDFNVSALDEFYILFYGSLPEILGGDREKAKFHFDKALEKTGGRSAGPYVAYAQTICVPVQDYEGFTEKLEQALAVDEDAEPSIRLMNVLSKRKARFLLDHAYKYFSFLPSPYEAY